MNVEYIGRIVNDDNDQHFVFRDRLSINRGSLFFGGLEESGAQRERVK